MLSVPLIVATEASGAPARGPLRVSKANPRYFADRSGKVIYLTGSHTWSNLQDLGESDPPKRFNFNAYLEFLQKHNHNFVRLWRWELTKWPARDGTFRWAAPHPWARTGPGLALDGKPKFNLKRFDPTYFQRLRSRVAAAGKRGIYVSIMLFEGWGMQFVPNAWRWHPFHPDNNTGLPNADTNGDGKGLEIYTLAHPQILAIQEAYIRKVVDTVNDLDNVLYEISNENHRNSTEWQYHMIRFIKQYESRKPKQHPVGMTFQYEGGKNADLFASPADWISPNPEGGYRDDPPPADGRKVVINDTDHLWGEGGDHKWVWKSFLRGHNPIYMDRIADLTANPLGDIPGAEGVRKAMGHTRTMANRINLATMAPRPDLASSQYCLTNPGKEYLVYLPEGGEVIVDLSAAPGTLEVEWLHPVEGLITDGGTVTGGAKREFRAPFNGDAVLYIWRRKQTMRKKAEFNINWQPLSSKKGDLPVPPGSNQQTLCLILDADKDGKNEFIIGCRGQAPALVWYRWSSKGWMTYLVENQALPIEAGGAVWDVDGDGDLDIIAGEDHEGNKVFWWENPYPNFHPKAPWRRHIIKDSGANQHHDQIFGDFNGDGKAEFVFWNQGAKRLFLAEIPVDPKAGPWPYIAIFEGAGEGLAKGDIDGDGKIELIAGGRWFKHEGGMKFTAYLIDETQSRSRIAVGDLNGDGHLEIVMVPAESLGRLKWYECRGDPKQTKSWVGHDLLGFDVKHGHSLAVADINGDGNLDIFCAEMRKWTDKDDNPDAKAWIFYGDGKGNFTKTELVTGHGFHEAKVADLNGDGLLDILNKPYTWETPRVDIWLQTRLAR